MIVLIAILIVLITYTLWMRRDIYKLSWQLPGPFAPPIIGNAFVAHPNRKINVFKKRISSEFSEKLLTVLLLLLCGVVSTFFWCSFLMLSLIWNVKLKNVFFKHFENFNDENRNELKLKLNTFFSQICYQISIDYQKHMRAPFEFGSGHCWPFLLRMQKMWKLY